MAFDGAASLQCGLQAKAAPAGARALFGWRVADCRVVDRCRARRGTQLYRINRSDLPKRAPSSRRSTTRSDHVGSDQVCQSCLPEMPEMKDLSERVDRGLVERLGAAPSCGGGPDGREEGGGSLEGWLACIHALFRPGKPPLQSTVLGSPRA